MLLYKLIKALKSRYYTLKRQFTLMLIGRAGFVSPPRSGMAARQANRSVQHGDPLAFKPNYGRDRAERQRAARARTEDKQRKREEKAALRKAERAATEAPADDNKTSGDA